MNSFEMETHDIHESNLVGGSGVGGGGTGGGRIRTIEWEMMNKSKFFPLSMLSSFSVRCVLYPFTVIKTCMQIQQSSGAYRGTFDAFKQITQHEGFMGLYRGFWISAFQIVSGVFYITTYETVRHFLLQNNVKDSRIRALIGGGSASMVGQTIIVPFDIISQHMMVLGMRQGTTTGVINPLNIDYKNRSRLQVIGSIIRAVYKKDGLKGYYRGYLASISVYVPNSALWWSFYHFYQDHIERLLPIGTSTLLIQCLSGPMSGATTTFITNPFDIVRARLQVQSQGGFTHTMYVLWKEERMGIFTKGLSPRLIQSVIFSGMVIFGYESVKRLSVSDEYQTQISW